jgi:glycosyltransferase involved in cell wall biosynthesis
VEDEQKGTDPERGVPLPPVRVVHLITELSHGGSQSALLRLLQASDGSRFRPLVACWYGGDGAVAHELRAAGFRVVDLGMGSGSRLAPLLRLYRLLRQERPQILHTWMFHANVPGRIIGRLAGVPVIISSERTMGQEGRMRREANRLTAPLADRIICVSTPVATYAREQIGLPASRLVVIPNGVALEGRPQRDHDERTGDVVRMGYVGRLSPVKGVDLLLEAAARLAADATLPRWELRIIGAGDERPALEEAALTLGLGDRVRFLGPRSDIPAQLAELDLLVLPSRWEGMPNVALEAMAARLPVVATAVGGTPEVVVDGETGLLTPAEDVAALTAALRSLILDADGRAAMGAAGRRRVEEGFTLAHAVARTAALYEDLLQEQDVPQAQPRRLRVLHPITRLIVGGAQENTMLTADLLDRRVWEVAVLSGTQIGSEGSLMESVRERGVPLLLEPTLVREVSPLNDARALVRMAQTMRRGRYDIVHTHSSKAGILGRWAAKLAGVPVIVHTVHGWGHHERQHPLVRAYYILLEKLSLPATDRLIVVSPLNIEKGLADGIGRREQYAVIRSGIELDRFGRPAVPREETRRAWGIPLDALVVGSVTRLSAQKAPGDFVRAAARIRRQWEESAGRGDAPPPVWFLVVGDGDLRPEVEALAAELGVRDRLVLTGLRRDVPELLAAMDIFVLSSLWEGLPRVLPQAMATGLPIVATAADGTAEAVTPGVNGFLTPPGDPDALAGMVLQLMAQPELARAMGAAGRARVDEFSDRRMVAQIDALYRELLLAKGRAVPVPPE